MSTNNSKKRYQVIIVGGGPVGLFLGCCLHKLGISFRILEKRKQRISHSRSLGIHPVSLELFEKIELVNDFLEAGIKIKRGMAFSGSGEIGSVSFETCPGPYRFILTLPQYKTEKILEKHLKKLNKEVLLRDAKLTGINQQDHDITVQFTHSGEVQFAETQFLIGCDGKHSSVRNMAGIPFEGTTYPDTYIMGDFSDNTPFGNDAIVFLPKEGMIESFPLEEDRRRWVVKTASYIEELSRQHIEKIVAERIGHDLSEQSNFMLSSFGVQKLMAKPLARGKIALAGDAAHIVSPIGGQGMNLGWLDAWDLAHALDRCFKDHTLNWEKELNSYGERRTKIANNAIRRAELNMRLGRATSIPKLRNALVRIMLKTPLQRLMARLFTMRNLDHRFL